MAYVRGSMTSQWHLYSHIMQSRLLAHTSFYREGAVLMGLDPLCSDAAHPERFFSTFRAKAQDESILRHLMFGGEQFSFLERIVEPFGHFSNVTDLFGSHYREAQLLLKHSKSRYFFWKANCFLKAYLANVSSYFFDPKGVGGNIPGIVLKEELNRGQHKVPVYWSASPTPFKKHHIAEEALKLFSLWKQREAPSCLVYCNLQSLFHKRERERSEKLLSFAKDFPNHVRLLHISVDAPLYLEAPKILPLDVQCQEVIKELSKKNSMYHNSLAQDLQAQWLLHAVDVAESTKEWVKTKNVKNSSRVFMELFSLSLARRWVGYTLFSLPHLEELYLMQSCRECIDRGATFIFEQALGLSSLSIRELRALFWGRALLVRGRLPYEIRTVGCRELFSTCDRKEIGLHLEEQLAKGLGEAPSLVSRVHRYDQ